MVTASSLWKFHYSSDEAAGRDLHCTAAWPLCLRWFQGMWHFAHPLWEFFRPQPGPTVLCPASVMSPDLHAVLHILSCIRAEALASFERWEYRSCIICTRHWKMSHGVATECRGILKYNLNHWTLHLLSASAQCSEMRLLQTQWEKALSIELTEVSRTFI